MLQGACLLFLLCLTIAAQTPTILPQRPTVSRTHVAFSYAGDLWSVARAGGEAQRLTSGPGVETDPVFSPDGNTIAFTGEYDGNVDVFVVPAAGGVPRRLTHHPGADVGEVIAVAMQDVLPDKAVPQTYKTGIPTIIVGVDPRTGQPFTDHSAEVYAGWCNAAKGMDAWGAQNASFGNLWKATAEINESLYPHV